MKELQLALRLLRRDARAGELRLLVAALLIAVAALSAVGFLTDRVQRLLEREAQQLLGADLLLSADQPWPEAIGAEARRRGLQLSETRTFPSMVAAGEHAQLVEIKAVAAGYPLRGELLLADRPGGLERSAAGAVPAAGEVWIDARLATALALAVDGRVAVGRSALRVGAVLAQEPDRGVNFFAAAPRLLMNLADLPATGLVQVGSRVTYRLLLAGDPAAVAGFRRWVEARLERGQRVEGLDNARPEIRSALDRAQRFLGLAALLTVVLAAVAVALAARRHTQRHLDPCAVMRCLGATQAQLLRLFVWQFALLGIGAALVGGGFGYLAHLVLVALLTPLLAAPLPPPSALPLLQGALVGLLLLLGFALPPLLQLRRVPTLRVLRREFGAPGGGLLGGYLFGLAGLAAAMFWIAGEVTLGGVVVGGFLAALLVFALAARAAIRGLAALRGAGGIGWRYGLARLERRPLAGVVQIVALALGLMALLLLTATRGDLLQAWHRALPPDAPNRFVINIQPQQVEPVRRLLAAEGIAAAPEPMVRGRLTRLRDAAVSAADYDDDRAKRLVEREFNLSWRADLPPGNRVVAGRWFAPGERGAALASVEEGLARTLGIGVGDRIEFNVGGEPLALQVVGLRKLDWDSMRVNFFVLTPPGVLEDFPASYITSFYLDAAQAGVADRLVREFPNLTLIDVAAVVRQLQTLLDQVALAVQFIFLFTLAAGVVVLYGALATAFDERRYELAVMRALGARREQLRGALLAELAAVGGCAGFIAAVAAAVVGQVLARRVFHFEMSVSVMPFLLAPAAGASLVAAAGWFAVRRLLRTPPLTTLRGAG